MKLASPNDLVQHSEPRHPRELRDHNGLIYANDSFLSTWHFRHRGQALSVPVRGRIVANNGQALIEAAARSMGIARQPDFIAEPFLARGQVSAILQKFEDAPLGIYAVLPSNRYVPHRVRVLIDHLAQALAGR